MSVTESAPQRVPKKKRQREYNWITPRFWHGMRLAPWLRLLWRRRFAVSPSRLPMALAITYFALNNSLLHCLQEAIYGRRAAATELRKPPLFIIGHWRSGTTMLHELLVLDPHHNSPTTYECFVPSHFLLTARIITRWFNWVLPEKRPMDNMAAGWRKPQEDEFALCNLGLPSPYLTMAFPNAPSAYPEYLDLATLSVEERTRWKAGLRWFLQRLALQNPRRIVLKSPPHTARVATLLEMFPDAQFVHIVRDPLEVFSSTVRLWKSLYDVQGLQVPRYAGLEEHVLDSLERMYTAFERDRHLLRPEQLYEVRYEDLVQDTVGQLKAIYEQLDLGDFDQVQPRLQRYLEGVRDYQTRTETQSLPTEIRSQIAGRWSRFFDRHGYTQS